jgi:hypothetical protein
MKTDRKSNLQAAFREFQVVERSEGAGGDLPIKIKEPRNPERVIRFVASDDTVDRYNEVVLASGWDLADFVKNPVIMGFHNYQSWPLGTATAIGVVGNALLIDCEFDPPEVDEAADLAFRKIKHGTVKTGSVGFRGIEAITPDMGQLNPNVAEMFKRYPKARRIFTKQSLLEFTICPLPANPNAMAAALKAHMQFLFESDDPNAGAVADSFANVPQKVLDVAERVGRVLDRMATDRT